MKFVSLSGLTTFWSTVKSYLTENYASKDEATTEKAGLLSAADKTKLDSITIPDSVTATLSATELTVGDTAQITSIESNVIYQSNDVVSVSPSGVVTALKAGTGTIYVIPTLNTSLCYTLTVTVNSDVIGEVSTANVITLYDTLDSGTYTLKYEDSTNTALEDFDDITTLTI